MATEQGQTRFGTEQNQRKGVAVLVEDLSPTRWRFSPRPVSQYDWDHAILGHPQRSQEALGELAKGRASIDKTLYRRQRFGGSAGRPYVYLDREGSHTGKILPWQSSLEERRMAAQFPACASPW
jgi:hypothetical protein